MAAGAPNTAHNRRTFLKGAAALAGSAWLPAFRISRADATASCAVPPRFPASIELYQQGYENWAGAIKIDALWTCAPKDPDEVLTVVNWARRHGYRVRPRAAMHGWSPLCVTPGMGCDSRVVMLDTTQHLTAMRVVDRGGPAVVAEAGASLDNLQQFLENNGLGFTATPAVGAPTVGGVLTIGGHGASLPANGERRPWGHTYGSLTNLVLELTAVTWNEAHGRYELRRFERSDPRTSAILAHLGRTFVTSATLRVGQNRNLRCQSFTDIPATELFAEPGSAGRTFSGFVHETGRAEAIWYPFTDKPWFKVWSDEPAKPSASRLTNAPYNYPFSDHLPPAATHLVHRIIEGDGSATPAFGQTEYEFTVAGLAATDSADIWGKSKNVLFYIRASTLRLDECGFAVLTHRGNIQRVVSKFAAFHQSHMNAHRARGEYPINGPVEIRACGLDHPHHAELDGATAPTLTATTPVPDHPEWDCAIWFNVLTFPGTAGEYRYYRDVEAFMNRHFAGGDSAVRVEWSKGWGFSRDAIWENQEIIRRRIPSTFPRTHAPHSGWAAASRILDGHDPHRVFSNPFLEELFPRS